MSSNQNERKEVTRRDFFKGAIVAGTAIASIGHLNGLAHADESNSEEGERETLSDWNIYGADLEYSLLLKSSPIGIKMLNNSGQIPSGAYKPSDEGKKFALCQAYGMARRQAMIIAMFAEDHWCFEPIIALGLKKPPEIEGLNYLEGDIAAFLIEDKKAAKKHAQKDVRLHYREGRGMVFGPLKSINFDPDLVMIYCNPGQLRHLTLCIGYKKGYMVGSSFYGIGSCSRATATPYRKGEAIITVPDPGELERAGTPEDTMILTVPTRRNKKTGRFLFDDMMEGLYTFNEKMQMPYTSFAPQMWPDFPQPPFYEALFGEWGL